MTSDAQPTGPDTAEAVPAAQVQALRRIALAAVHPGGPDLFAHLARELAASLQVGMVFVAVFGDDSASVMRTLAACLDGRLLRNFEYPLQGSPCAAVVGHSFQFIASGLLPQLKPGSLSASKGMDSFAAFPLTDSAGEALGLVVAMDRQPIAAGDVDHAEAMLKIVAGRAAAEIERGRTDDALRAVALAVSDPLSGTVFDELVRLLATILRVEVAFIARYEPVQPGMLRVLAMYEDGQIVQDTGYRIAGTPCETVLGQRFRAYPARLRSLFPQDRDAFEQCIESYAGHPLVALDGSPLGTVAVASRRPLARVNRVEAMLKIFAVRAAAEVERLRAAEAQKQAVEELRVREAQYRAIFEGSQDGLFIWDENLRIVDVNPAGLAIYRQRREDLIGHTYPRRMPQDYVSDRSQLVRRALAGESIHLETTVLRPDGTTFDADLRLMPFAQGGQPHAITVVRDISERRRRERALQRSEARLRATVEAAFDAVVGMDSEGAIVEFNAAAERVFGYRRKDVLGRPLAEVLLPRRHHDAYQREMASLRDGAGGSVPGRLVQTIMLRADGTEIPVEVAMSVAVVPEGNIFVGHVRDISERQRADQALRDSEEQYRAIFNASVDALVLRDAAFRIVDVNAMYEAMSGNSRAEVLGVDEIPRNPPEVTAERRALHQRALAGEAVRFETELVRRDGHPYELELRGVSIQHRGQPHVLYIGRDITQAKQAERALRASEEQYRAIFNASADALVLRDADYRAVEVNPAYATLSGYTREEVMASDRVLTQADAVVRRRHREEHELALAGKELRFEVTATRKDGSTLQAEVRGTPMMYRGRPHVLYAVRDITARNAAEQRRRELERQLRQAQKMEAIGQLTGGIAHDFNNILTSVIGYVVMSQEGPAAAADPVLARQLGQARLAAERARDHVAQLLAFSRPRRGERRLQALEPVARQALQLLRPNLPSSIAVECAEICGDAEPTVPPVVADPVQLEQVLFNLCINARDAIGGSGTIRVRIGHSARAGHCASCSARIDEANWVWVEVADDGRGMPPDVIERMFEPFFTTKEVGRGTGMGLAMVHGIVHDHEGHIQVESAPGQGSVFRVLLPAAAQEAPGAEALATPAAAAVKRAAAALQGRVLLVEDEVMVGEYMVDLLTGWGLDVVLERDPLAAAAR
ncbi:MAG TPA: PAS domain S-box protein, partial [Ramlibacter sp.]